MASHDQEVVKTCRLKLCVYVLRIYYHHFMSKSLIIEVKSKYEDEETGNTNSKTGNAGCERGNTDSETGNTDCQRGNTYC